MKSKFGLFVYIPYLIFGFMWLTVSWASCGSDLSAMNRMQLIEGKILSAKRSSAGSIKANAPVKVEYEFTYQGRTIIGNSFSLCTGSNFSGSVIDEYAEIFEKMNLTIKGPVSIWMDPKHPNRNYLLKKIPLWWIFIDLMTLIIGLAIVHSVLTFLRNFYIAEH
jgi:hypothetical protein